MTHEERERERGGTDCTITTNNKLSSADVYQPLQGFRSVRSDAYGGHQHLRVAAGHCGGDAARDSDRQP